jgi:hypothetical protein
VDAGNAAFGVQRISAVGHVVPCALSVYEHKKTNRLMNTPNPLLDFNIAGNFFNIIKYERLFMLSLVYSNLKVKIVTLNFLL